ncbi:HD domain-containing protein [Ornithinimicrobium sediminis]|uniref:HD domain-containing protein n=1 Tax=Ornithinimicrobium sediminis TaxID=2904603 RepID=UPI001E5ACB65|nr:hypothetical protein [Ornithinimicrobium sediminis]MCE0486093.1 hypothetical protein [Ornithinimicrobium sediminis]
MDVGTLPASVSAALVALAPDAGPELHRAELQRIHAAWAEPHRAYHTLRHLTEMLEALEELACAGELDDDALPVARVAAAYHDVRYDPRAAPGSNEHRSAALARDHLHRLGADPADVDVVEALVLLTVDHDPGAVRGLLGRERLRDAFSDADLWILGAPATRYAAYARSVRAEYAHVPTATFRTARAAVLRTLLDRHALYATAHARRAWEDRARTNVAGEIAALTTEGPS